MEYLPGGVDSGFRTVDRDAYTTRLIQVKGKRTVRSWEVPCTASSLNTGDVFILDTAGKIFLYNGKDANRMERMKGLEVASRIKDQERGGRPELVFMDEDPRCAEFWAALGGYIEITDPGPPDDDVSHMAPKMFKISDATGSVTFEPVTLADGKLKRSQLDTNDVFLVDVGSKIYLWIGRGANLVEKKESMPRAAAYLRDTRGGNANVPVERVGEDCESSLFKAEFSSWNTNMPKPAAMKSFTPAADTPVDVTAFLERQKQADTPVDDGSGTLTCWRVEDFKLAEVPKEKYGNFYGGDSYVLSYTYTKPGSSREEVIIYFWQGETSSLDEKGASALLAKEMDDNMGGKATQVRVVQGKEPAHFRQLFRGNLVVHAGGKASGFKNRDEGDSYDTDGIALFIVKGSDALNTSAKQVAEVAASLNSSDAFVLVTPSHCYAWKGRGATSEEQTMALHIANKLAGDFNGSGGRETVSVEEGCEPPEFWAAIGGQGEYASGYENDTEDAREPRLFHCSNAAGTFKVEEVEMFQQIDLLDEDVFILDVYSQLYVWVGSGSNTEERSKAMEFAQSFINNATDGRSNDIPIVRISANNEPLMFTSYFMGWDTELFNKNKFEDPYEKKLREAAAKKAGTAVADAPAAAPAPAPVTVFSASGAYSYEELKSGIPAGVDPSKKEEYLTEAVFQEKFGMDKAAFSAQPKWKRDAKKKELGLF